ncbi:MAG TPA: NrfD/PsrC family molybdoenzyme membrane anchor subunit [Symbiobacteriaceae bacterium]|nr:NrfD/PsrC family molybdoenzyme membrane anchor subunit [Symbiobacteriaceae bacterium]
MNDHSMRMAAAAAPAVTAGRTAKERAETLPPDAPELLRPVVETGTGFYILLGVLIGIMAWGLVGYLYQLKDGLGVTGMRSYYSWGIYIISFVFFIGVSHAGTLISAILRVSGANWRHPITRLAEVITGVAILIGAPMVIIDLGRPDRILNLIIHGRLQSPLLWDVVSVTTYLFGSLTYLWLPMIPDLAKCYPYLKDRHPVRAWIYKKLSMNWTGTPEQHRILEKIISIMAIVIMPVAISVHTVVSFIFSMTLREGWHSTIFGPYFVVGAIYSGIGALIVAVWIFRKVYDLERYITEAHFTKLGYLLIASGLVYLYTTFSEYLTGFYTKEEAELHLISSLFTGQFSGVFWAGMAFTFVPVLVVALRRWTGMFGLVTSAVALNVGMWLKRYIIVTPTLGNPFLPIQNVANDYQFYHPTWVEWSILAAGVCGFILLYALFSKLFPVVSIWETEDDVAPAHGHKKGAHAS